MCQVKIRSATPADAPRIQAIYAPVVSDTAISFETETPDVEEMRRRITGTLVQYPWLVAEDAGGLAGYVYASRYAERLAYRWSVSVAAYVHADQHRRGIGKALYRALFEQLKAAGYCQAYAGITQPNAASVALHESMGFTPVGIFANAGYKLGQWHDVGYWQLSLQRPEPPRETLLLS